MIRQNFNIDKEEVIRILNLHETATKNHYLVLEQIKKTKELPPKEFALPPQMFKSGYHSEGSLDPSQKKEIETVLGQMAQYIAEKKGTPMSIQIVTGESIPKNFDNENQVSLKRGELAKLRGNTIKSILTKFFQGLVDKKIIPSMPSIPDPKTNVELGMKQVPYTKGTDDPKDKKYEADQFIKFTVVSSGQETSECLVDLTVVIQYIHRSDERFPCRGNHHCNDARFNVYLNTTLIGVADLNNLDSTETTGVDSLNRVSRLVVNKEMVNSIVNKPDFNNRLLLWYKPAGDGGSHSSVPEVYIYNNKKERLFPNSTFPNACVAPQAARGDKTSKILMFLDGCGNPISVDQTTSAEEIKSMGDAISAEEKKVKDAEHQKYLKYLDMFQTTGGMYTPGLTNTNIFDESTYEINDMVQQGDNLQVTFTPKYDRNIGYFEDKGYGRTYKAKKGKSLKVLIPIVKVKIFAKERVFRKDNENLPKVGDFGYFTSIPIYGVKTDVKVPKGVIFQPTFEPK